MFTRLSTLILALSLVAGVATAQNRPPREPREPLMEKLNLTEQQQKQFDALVSEFRKERVDRRAEVAKARIEMMDLLKAEPLDQGKITAQIEKIGRLEIAAKSKGMEHWFAVNKILTPEQQKVWKRGMVRFAQGQMMDRGMRTRRMHTRAMEPPEPGEPRPR